MTSILPPIPGRLGAIILKIGQRGYQRGDPKTHSQTGKDCPWDTIVMVPRATVEGHVSSIESQLDRDHPIFERVDLLNKRVGKPLTNPASPPAA